MSVTPSKPGTGTTWNSGKLIGPKPPLQAKHVWAIRRHLQLAGKPRYLALFNLANGSKLRGCDSDVVAVSVAEIAAHGHAPDRATVRPRKTGRPAKFELTGQTREAVDAHVRQAGETGGDYLFDGRGGQGRHLSTRQYARLVGDWVRLAGLEPALSGTHPLAWTKATLIYRRTGDLRAVQLLLGHTKIESTVRHLGVEVDDALAIAEKADV